MLAFPSQMGIIGAGGRREKMTEEGEADLDEFCETWALTIETKNDLRAMIEREIGRQLNPPEDEDNLGWEDGRDLNGCT
jgi:hypothetical protein